MVGQRTLNPFILVRIQAQQPQALFSLVFIIKKTFSFIVVLYLTTIPLDHVLALRLLSMHLLC